MLGLVGPWEKLAVPVLGRLMYVTFPMFYRRNLATLQEDCSKNKMFLPTTVGTSFHLKTYQCVQTLRYWRTWLEKCLSV